MRAFETPWPDVAARFASGGTVAILPFGALEQHGPHLPLGTDTITAEYVASALAETLGAVLLPPVNYGDTWNNAGYPGTISLRSSTVTAIAVDIGVALQAAGAAGLVIVNGDWGNRQPLYSATRELLERGMPTITLDYPGMDAAISRVRESEPAAPGLNHAEEVETSIMLAIDASRVHTDRFVASYPEFPSDFGVRPMQLHPFSPSGVFGDPSTATAAKGTVILDATVAESLRVLDGFLGELGVAIAAVEGGA